MTIDLVILCVIMALYIGWKASAIWHLYTFRTLLEELKVPDHQLRQLVRDKAMDLGEPTPEEAEDDDTANLPVLEVRIEQQPEGLFAYRKDNDLFIAMGKDHTQLMENLIDNLVNVRVVIAKEDGADLIYPQNPA
jgi:hypothetical protein